MTILWKLGDNLFEDGWSYIGWWLTIRVMIGNHPREGHPLEAAWPSLGGGMTIHGSYNLVLTIWVMSSCQIPMVTILWMVGDHLLETWWLFFGWWETILRMVGDHPGDGGWPDPTVVTWSKFCELSLCAKFQICCTLLSGRLLIVGGHPRDVGWLSQGWSPMVLKLVLILWV